MPLKKVAIFTHGVQSGPFARLSTTLARGFHVLGVECDVVVLRASKADRSAYPDVSLVNLKAKRAALSVLPLVRYLRREQPDVLFSMPWYFNVLAIWARALSGTSTRVILGEHNICSLEAAIEHPDKLQTRYLPLLMRYSYGYADGLIAVCQDTIEDLHRVIRIPAQLPTTVIPNPIDIARVQQTVHQAMQPIELSDHQFVQPVIHPWLHQPVPIIVTIARMAKQKQLDHLLRSFAQVLQSTPARLIILGDGPLRSELEDLCQDLNITEHVDMPGYIANPYPFLSACDVFVLASAWEGCPIALQEALTCGAATIVSDAPGGSKEIVAGGVGMVVPTKDENALANAICTLLHHPDLKQQFQQRGKLRSTDFQYLSIAQRYLDFAQAIQEKTLASDRYIRTA